MGKHGDGRKLGDTPLPRQPPPSKNGRQPGGKGSGKHEGGKGGGGK